MKKETVLQLMTITKQIDIEREIFENVGISVEVLGDIRDFIHDTILDDFGVPEDNSSEFEHDEEGFFSRDYYYYNINEYEEGKLSIDEFIHELNVWKIEREVKTNEN